MTDPKAKHKGYGNIYTPHAGSMIIQVQREGGLANRTIVLSPRRVRLLRFILSRTGALIGAGLALVFVFLAIQAVRVPVLTHRLASMERDARRLDTLELTLSELQKRYEQVQTMLGASPALKSDPAAPATTPAPAATTPAPTAAAAPAADSAAPAATLPTRYPLDEKGFITRGVGSGQEYGATHPGLDIAVPERTQVRAAGGGMVVEVGESPEYGRMIRLAHPQGYETLYGHLSETRVRQGERVAQGAVIGLSGNTGRSTAPHLHFELRRAGTAVDPMTLIQQTRR